MAKGTVRVRGLRELQRDFRKMSGDLPKELRSELKEAGQIVATEAARLFRDRDPRSAASIVPRVRTGLVAVEQRRGKTTGQHKEFGVLQMREALLPGLAAKQEDVLDRLDKMLDRLGGANGF